MTVKFIYSCECGHYKASNPGIDVCFVCGSDPIKFISLASLTDLIKERIECLNTVLKTPALSALITDIKSVEGGLTELESLLTSLGGEG